MLSPMHRLAVAEQARPPAAEGPPGAGPSSRHLSRQCTALLWTACQAGFTKSAAFMRCSEWCCSACRPGVAEGARPLAAEGRPVLGVHTPAARAVPRAPLESSDESQVSVSGLKQEISTAGVAVVLCLAPLMCTARQAGGTCAVKCGPACVRSCYD